MLLFGKPFVQFAASNDVSVNLTSVHNPLFCSFKHHEKSSDRRSSSSSKVSWESPGPVKQAADEYVLVDLVRC